MSIIGKKVIYNGGTESCYGCSDSEVLVKGRQYTVVGEHVRDWQTNLKLAEVDGDFNSVWFNEVEEKKVYIAFSKHMPTIGSEHFLVRIENGNIQPVNITKIIDITHLEGDIYRIETETSVYMTEIKEE